MKTDCMLRIELDKYQEYPYMRTVAWGLVVVFFISACTNFYDVIYQDKDLFRLILGIGQISVAGVWIFELKRIAPFNYFIELLDHSVQYRKSPLSQGLIGKNEIEDIQFNQTELCIILKNGKKKKFNTHHVSSENKDKIKNWLVANIF